MMTIDEVLQKLPSEMRGPLRSVLETLPSSERDSVLSLFKGLPGEVGTMRSLLGLSVQQIKQAFGSKQRVAIVGPANVGKSTLYNQFIQHKNDKAEVSPIPGTTRENQQADAGLFALVDTPGADAVGEVGAKERDEAFKAARAADVLVIMFDAIQGVKQTEQELFHQLQGLGKPYIVVLNKIDLVKRSEQEVTAKAAENLNIPVEQVIPVAAKNGENLSKVLIAIAAAEPQMIAALGRALPQYRWQLAWRTIASSASVSAAIALTPLPVIDFVPLVVTQSVMVLGVARIYNYNITLQRARELVVTFGLGFIGRTLFQELSKLGGVPGWILSAAIAASTTVVMGLAAATWFDKGEKMSSETLNRMTRAMTQTMLDTLKSLGKRKPSKEALQQAVQQSLEDAQPPVSQP